MKKKKRDKQLIDMKRSIWKDLMTLFNLNKNMFKHIDDSALL